MTCPSTEPVFPVLQARLRRMAWTASAVLLLALGGCETVQFGPDTTTPGDSTSRAEAELLLVNQRQEDPGPLTFLFYPPAAQDIESAAPSKEFGPVEYGKSAKVKVPAGRWKVGYRLTSGDLRAMPHNESEATSARWPVVTLAGGKTYQLLIETDEGGNTVWRYNLPVEASGP